MATYYSLLPQNAKDSQECASSDAKLTELRSICENVEMVTSNDKLTEAQVGAYHFQLIVYLVLDELTLAKYLCKRVPKEVMEKDTFAAIWNVGCSMWANDAPAVYSKLQSGKWSPLFAPFLQKMEANFRAKQAALITKAYTSIRIDELLNSYLGFKDVQTLNSFIAERGLSNTWLLDNADQPQKITIQKQTEDYQELLNAQRLMAQFTKYVVFMESQQKLEIDEISAANAASKN
mmetsp:Transcript_28772/g.47169  ORF Transcript_28772/g.47169 Transcript_28772/m.47169 type:complete len:234 (-) Transcript_28772:1024-1725(-)